MHIANKEAQYSLIQSRWTQSVFSSISSYQTQSLFFSFGLFSSVAAYEWRCLHSYIINLIFNVGNICCFHTGLVFSHWNWKSTNSCTDLSRCDPTLWPRRLRNLLQFQSSDVDLQVVGKRRMNNLVKEWRAEQFQPPPPPCTADLRAPGVFAV